MHKIKVDLPVYKAKLVNSLDSERNLSHVKASNVLCEDLVLDEHGHEVATRQELHEHV
jgi:hypothetical protein